MPLSDLVRARFFMMVLTSLFTIPVNAVVWVAFAIQTWSIERAGGSQSVLSVVVGIFGWIIAAAQVGICSAVIIVLTAAEMSDEGNAKVPCNCRISHNKQQSVQWLLMVGFNILFWLFVSRPTYIGVILFGTDCNQKGRRTARGWSNALAKRRSTWRGPPPVGTEMVGVSSPGSVDGGVEGEPVDGGVVVTIERSKSDNIKDNNGDGGVGIGGTLKGQHEIQKQGAGVVGSMRPVLPPSKTDESSKAEEQVESKGDGGDGSAGRTTIEARRLSAKPSVQRRTRRYGSSEGKKKARGKKKAFEVEPSNVAHKRTSSASRPSATSITPVVVTSSPASTVVSPVASLAGGESKGASAADAGGKYSQEGNATTVFRGQRTQSIEL